MSDVHIQLIELGVRWMQMNGFGVVSTDLGFIGHGACARPDVLAFRSTCSAILITKRTRKEFLADANNPWRSEAPGLGVYRFYLCPEGVITPDEVPARWGLLYEVKGKVKNVVVPQGNLWLANGDQSKPYSDFLRFQHQTCAQQERHALYSIARQSLQRSPLIARHFSRSHVPINQTGKSAS